ncbi:MAG: hypothetical protein WCX73_05625 [Candidatus Pacearchaeota archaeon]|jgi:heme/copper-type cytochrome/quinol oxidase subunit 4
MEKKDKLKAELIGVLLAMIIMAGLPIYMYTKNGFESGVMTALVIIILYFIDVLSNIKDGKK